LPKIRLLRPKTIGVLAMLLAGGVGTALWVRHVEAPAAQVPPPAGVPVEAAIAARNPVPIYLEGLGTVQAFNTVTVTTRVDGQLQSLNFTEGQDVKAGDVLAQIDPRPYQATLDQAVATKAKDDAQLANAKRDLQRYIMLAPHNFTSTQTLDTQRALVAQLEAQVQIDQAQIDSAKTNLDYSTIRSPINGRTGIRGVDAGNNLLASANTGIVVITQLQPISVVFTLPEESLPEVSAGMAQGLRTAVALSRDNKTELDRGTLAVLDNEINQANGTIRLKATFPNSNKTLWPGDFANVKLLVRTETNAISVPASALQRGPNGLYVFVIKPDKTAEIRPIALEQFYDGKALIKSGLHEGEKVVTGGQYRLQPGARVEFSTPQIAVSQKETSP
jgi:multidrug efflux system membrane fusion protein